MISQRCLEVPVGVSARHAHLSDEHVQALFGHELHADKNLSQRGEYAAKEKVTIASHRNAIQGVRVLGPSRQKTQIELSVTDAVFLGISPVVRLSGNTDDTPGLTLIGPKGSIQLTQGTIVAARHLHITPMEASRYELKNLQIVSAIATTPRKIIFDEVIVRIASTACLELHLDTDEANAALLTTGDMVRIIIPDSQPEANSSGRFLCTEDVINMLREGQMLHFSPGLRITQAALDLARSKGILIT